MTHGQSALREVDLDKQIAADAGIIIHAYMTTQEASFVSTMTTPKNDHLCKHVLTISRVYMTNTCASMFSPRIEHQYRRLESIVSTD